ncbi:hypothetical protein [Nocardioides sp. Root140]|uniref:hypothetical protein n=1 Tax=Nocardioides sp. Root140 TaxID=1736460 RepID=UPI0006FF8F0D|nr:hypothetical protein [Nocardioides sp. Root140]KQY61451.1 hypothetical protein ASD30_25675 [Nocardioides sp. Root140]
MPDVISYDQLDALEVEVLVEGVWCFGTLHEWRLKDERWIGWVRYNTGPGKNWIGQFDQDLIRPYTYVDPRSAGITSTERPSR